MPVPESSLDYSAIDAQLAGLLQAPRWLVGFSGGIDSTVLLHLLQRWCQDNPGAPPLSAVHINHGMQSAADDWQEHCEWLCRMLKVPFIARRLEVEPGSRGSEAAAREARYRVFEEELGAGDVLFLAHHLDDQVETFFLRLVRGAGVHGLAAIPASRKVGEGTLVRPLLHLTRQQLEAYASEQGLESVADPSNADSTMDRNFLRNELLPLLATRWPGYRQTIARASDHMAGTVSALEEALPVPQTVYSVTGDPGLALSELLAGSDEAVAVRLRRWLQVWDMLAPDQVQLEEFLRQLRRAGPQKKPRLACSAYTLQRYRDTIYLLPDTDTAFHREPMTLRPGEIYDVPGVGRVGLEPADEQGLSLKSGEKLVLCWRQGGERCQPQGRSGSNSLKKLLQEREVPPWWRDRVPLLYRGDELLAVGDLWLCESSRLRATAGRWRSLWRLSWQPYPDGVED